MTMQTPIRPQPLYPKRVIKRERRAEVDGAVLGQYAAEHFEELDLSEIDVSELSGSDQVSAFVNNFLNALEKAGVDLLRLELTTWKGKFPGETARMNQFHAWYMGDYKKKREAR